MKKALIVLMLVASASVFAQSVTSLPNLSGGENFFSSDGRYLGSTYRNLGGGRNFHPSHEMQMRQRAFQSQQRMQSIRERRRLRGADNWDWSK